MLWSPSTKTAAWTCPSARKIDLHGNDEHAVVIVEDNGCGMTPEVIDHLVRALLYSPPR